MTVKIIVGNSLEILRGTKDRTVHCIVTSPPYYGLRDYGIEPTVWGGDFKCEHVFSEEKSTREIRKGIGLEALSKEYRGGGKKAGAVPEVKIDRGDCQCGAWRGVLGLEPTPDLFVEHMVEIFEECRRVLRDDGTLWLNLGDTYAGSGRGGAYYDETSTLSGGQKNQKAAMQGKRSRAPQEMIGLKPKDLVGIRSATETTYREWALRYGELPQERLRTEVDVREIKSTNPGYCYLRAGWERGERKRGKLFLYAPERPHGLQVDLGSSAPRQGHACP
jgi:hypothetical protein